MSDKTKGTSNAPRPLNEGSETRSLGGQRPNQQSAETPKPKK